jgi:deoxyribodipyrimidine photo-lyase
MNTAGTPRALIWFKRDLRLADHAAVAAASARCPGQPLHGLYIIEPGLWAQEDAAAQHWAFIRESLIELAQALQAQGGSLRVRTGDAVSALQAEHACRPFNHLMAHEETGNGFTYARDLAVQAWCRSQGIAFQEWPQMGVVRRMRNRDHWHINWERFMREPIWPSPTFTSAITPCGSTNILDALPSPMDIGLNHPIPPRRQQGGRTRGLRILQDFLNHRAQRYRGGISSPLSAPSACSRLSPYLAYGCLSAREVVQATRAQLQALREHGNSTSAASTQSHIKGLEAFLSRMHWHCHFIQKLEDEPELEWLNLHRGYDGLREAEHQPAHFEALINGRTGWPMVDACVAMLRHTGWVNFRMRAMLVSVAAYPLWLHWRPVGLWLARQFLDYEPGIHWSQLQMQSGTTGINTTRVYNPIKQARDHDPHGRFVRQWLPHMRKVPDAWLFEPWRMPASVQNQCGLRVGADIPLPLVDLDDALRTAKARLHARRADSQVRAAVNEIVRKHGSRAPRRDSKQRQGQRRPGKSISPTSPGKDQAQAQAQMQWDF